MYIRGSSLIPPSFFARNSLILWHIARDEVISSKDEGSSLSSLKPPHPCYVIENAQVN
jgi:hypothetical protein